MPGYRPNQQQHTSQLPAEITNLPLNLRRTSLVTRQPYKVASGVLAFMQRMAGAPVPLALPQSFLTQQWKKNAGGSTRGGYKAPLQSAKGLVRAMQHSVLPQSTVRRLESRPVHLPIGEAGAVLAAGGFPQPPTGQAPAPVARTAPRGLVTRTRPPPAAVAQAHAQYEAGIHEKRVSKCTQAMDSALSARLRVLHMATGR